MPQSQFVTVNLADSHWIDYIQLVTVAVHSNRFRNVKIYVYNEATFQGGGQCDSIVNEPTWFTLSPTAVSYNSSCTNLVGQYVRIEMEGFHAESFLQMCEVMVFGKSNYFFPILLFQLKIKVKHVI